MRWRVWLLGPLVFAAIVATAAAAANARVGDCAGSYARPSTIILDCASRNTQLTHLRWTLFGGQTARGTGDLYTNNCTPSCAAGHFNTYPVTIVLSAAQACPDGWRDYRRAHLAYSTPRRPENVRGISIGLKCPSKSWLPLTERRVR